jgi:hypothetical protein
MQLSRGEGLESSYQEGRVWDPVIKRGGFRIQLSRGEGWDPVIKMGGFGIQL